MAQGSVYRPTYKAADGTTKRQAVYWLAYYQGGKLHRKSSGTKVRADADRKLRELLKAADEGAPPEPSERVTVDTLRRLVAADLEVNGRKSGREAVRAFGHLTAHFRDREARAITPAAVDAYKAARLASGAARATVNRELAQLRRGFRLAVKGGLLARRPDFSLMAEHNRRRGFFEGDELEAVVAKLPEHLRGLLRFLFWTGWRSGEARGLEWRQVDLKAGVIRLDDSKSGEPRTIPYGVLPVLRAIVEAQRQRADQLQRAAEADGKRKRLARIVRHVFFTPAGFKIHDLAGEWDTARKAAGLPGRLVHDCRRTAARNMLRAGIPQAVAMQIGGWKTDSIFRRYAIVDERLLAENLRKLDPEAARG